MRIVVPSKLDLKGVTRFALELSTLQSDREGYIFDFSKMDHVPPFGMLLASRALRAFSNKHGKGSCKAEKFANTNTYAAHMGFYKSFGLAHGNNPGEAPGSGTYLPLDSCTKQQLRQTAMSQAVHPERVLEAKAMQMAEILLRMKSGEIFENVRYSLFEMMRNVFEHSQAEVIWTAAQYWPSRSLVEIAIVDDGVGILDSLCRNPNLSLTNHESALRAALMPGISGTAWRNEMSSYQNEYENSGFGLSVVSRLANRAGSFVIASGDTVLKLEKVETVRPTFIQGTAIRIRIHTDRLLSLRHEIRSVVNEVEPKTSLGKSKSLSSS